MAVLYKFCLWYSVRLGTIIVSFTCIIQCLAAVIACSLGLTDLKRTSSSISHLLEKNNLKIIQYYLEAAKDDLKSTLISFIIILFIYLSSCVLLIYAVFKCNRPLMCPFLVLDFIRLCTFSFGFVILVMVIKENTIHLGIIIGASVIGIFTLLYSWYQWLCTVSLWQIIKEVQALDKRDMNNVTNTKKFHDEFNLQ